VIGGGERCTLAGAGGTGYIGMFGANCDNNEAEAQLAMPASGTLQELHATVSSAPGAGNSITFTIRKNGAGTQVTCTISDTATSCVDAVHAVGFATGDLLSVQIATSAGVPATTIAAGRTSQFIPS
jgi:hypothetical protein